MPANTNDNGDVVVTLTRREYRDLVHCMQCMTEIYEDDPSVKPVKRIIRKLDLAAAKSAREAAAGALADAVIRDWIPDGDTND